MVDRASGRASWTLDPYEVSLSFTGRDAQAGGGADWFGPLAPLPPAAPRDVAGRQWDYPAGFNLALQPRPYEPVSFATLRQLADGWDLLRLVIETRKDQVARMGWSIQSRSGSGDGAGATAFFARPDGLRSWQDWLRMLLEELFVIDAPTLYCRRDRAGRLTGLLPLDGATVKPVIDAWGRPPQPYVDAGATVWPTAYQQILKGMPAVDYSLRDLVYRPRNPRVARAYGFSPVEQIVTTVNIALRRQLFLTDYYTEGNIPDCLIGVPDGWTPDQIASYQKYWDAYFSGDAGRRRRAKFVPGEVAKSFVQTKEPELKTIFDDWLARIVCFAFSVSPQALVSQMNRATAEVQKTLAEEEGLAPILAWVKSLVDDILRTEFSPDLEFAWAPTATIDPEAQERMLTSYTSRGILTLNEARAALGRTPLAEDVADTAMTLTANGYVGLPEGSATQGGRVSKTEGWDKGRHPRWPAGDGDHRGGRFAPAQTSSSAQHQRVALAGSLLDMTRSWELPIAPIRRPSTRSQSNIRATIAATQLGPSLISRTTRRTMSDIILRQSAVEKLKSDPKIQHWQQHRSERQVPFLGYYRRSYSTSHDGTVTEHGDGFMLTSIDPNDQDETRDIVIKPVAVSADLDILVGGEEAIMARDFAIGWVKKFTYEPSAPS